MGKRQRRVLPFPAQQGASKPPKPLAVQECSDKEKLLYTRAMGPALAAVEAARQAAANTQALAAESMMEWAGLKQDDGWQLNTDKMRWERRNTPA